MPAGRSKRVTPAAAATARFVSGSVAGLGSVSSPRWALPCSAPQPASAAATTSATVHTARAPTIGRMLCARGAPDRSAIAGQEREQPEELQVEPDQRHGEREGEVPLQLLRRPGLDAGLDRPE